MASKFVFMPRFERATKQLKKRYRSIVQDIETALEEIEANPTIGTVIPNDYAVRKMRIASRDMQRGKSGGYRLLYRLTDEHDENLTIYLLFVYAKTEQEDVSLAQLEQLIEEVPPNDSD